MVNSLLHVFRNNAFGRETFLQSLYFCKKMGFSLRVYIPRHSKFLMYFENEVTQVDLDQSYLTDPNTAQEHVEALAKEAGLPVDFLIPRDFTASTLPDIPTTFECMCCPRSMSDKTSRIGLGYVGPRVRKIAVAAPFPVLVTSMCYKPWNSIAVFFGGSTNAFKALSLGLALSKRAGMPLDLFTLEENSVNREILDKLIFEREMTETVEKGVRNWHVLKSDKMENCLYEVPSDALTVLGAYGHGVIREALFGSNMEIIQSQIVNNMVIVGPKCRVF
ncbi:MAG: universal stress protein [Desulfatibacillum sp.]|nr:universal stress protein [Desulfatibacillum sp.]